MARLWQSGWELNSTTVDMEFSSISGTASISSTTVRTGGFAGRTNPAAATGFFRQHVFTTDQATTAYQRCYLRIAALPSGNTTIMRFTDVANDPLAQVRLTSAGTLILLDAGATQIGSASAALNTNQWYRLELLNDASINPGALDARIDGVSFASGANSVQGSWGRVIVGPVIATTCDLFWDDWAVNDSSGATQNTWPGDGQIIHLVPNADGDNHAWLDTAASAGTANNFQLVDEVPPNDAADLVQSVTLNAEDMYGITDPPAGGMTVNCVMVGGRYRNNTADATTAFRIQLKKTSGGTIQQSTSIIPNSITFTTNANAQPRNYPIIAPLDPDGAAWTSGTLASMQIGQKLTAAGTNRIQVTAVWASVDYTPSTSPTKTPAVVSQYSGYF
jgi:hypothetical protein